MPPSAMTGTPAARATFAHSMTAVICGTPTPATTRVVQIDPGPMPTFTRVGAGPDQVARRRGGGDVARDEVDPPPVRPPQPPHRVEHGLGVPVRGVDDDDVDAGLDQPLGALLRVAADADRGADAQPAVPVLAGVRVLEVLLDVLDGDQPDEPPLAVDDGQLLDAVAVQDVLGLLEGHLAADRDQVLPGHEQRDRPLEVVLEAQVAVREDADEPAALVLDDRHARDAVLAHQLHRLADRPLRGDRDRVDDHPALGALDLVDLERLHARREVLVDDADAALLREGDRQARLGHRVHRRRDDGDADADPAREDRRGADLARQHARAGRDQQDVVEGQRVRDHFSRHGSPRLLRSPARLGPRSTLGRPRRRPRPRRGAGGRAATPTLRPRRGPRRRRPRAPSRRSP